MESRTDERAKPPKADRSVWWFALAVALVAMGVVAILELWATPPEWLLPARRVTVRSLHWAMTHLLAAGAISAAAGVAALLLPFLFRRLDQRKAMAADRAGFNQERQAMLKRVRYKWIRGVLEPSLAHAARLALGLERRPDTLELGTRAVRRPGRPVGPLPPSASILDMFQEVGGGLLIQGAPGAGNTTLLLQLAGRSLTTPNTTPSSRSRSWSTWLPLS